MKLKLKDIVVGVFFVTAMAVKFSLWSIWFIYLVVYAGLRLANKDNNEL